MSKSLVGSNRRTNLLAQLLEEPELVGIVRSLEPKVLCKLIDHVGLEDAGELVALATTEQLKGIFDTDLWRSERPGKDETFDGERFARWLEVMLEAGAAFAAEKLLELDEDFLTLALCKNIFVIDLDELSATMSRASRSDEEDLTDKALESCLYQDIDGYQIIARNQVGWDAIVVVLLELDKENHSFLRRLLDRCCQISTDYIEDNGGLYDVLTAEDALEMDVAGDREERREAEGFVAPSAAASFLSLTRITPLAEIVDASTPDPITAAYLRASESRPVRPVRRADAARPASPSASAKFLGLFEDAGVLEPGRQVPLLGGRDAGKVDSLFNCAMRELKDHDPTRYSQHLAELSYIANALISGCSHDSRSFRPVEAIEAAVCASSLGLERILGLELPLEAGLSSTDIALASAELKKHGVVRLFRAGYNILYCELCCVSAQTLIELLTSTAAGASRETARYLQDLAAVLKTQLAARKPWAVREKLDGLVDILGERVVSTLGALLDEFPSLPKGVWATQDRRQKTRFVSRTSEVRAIRAALKAGEPPAQTQRRDRSRPAEAKPAPKRARTSRNKRQ